MDSKRQYCVTTRGDLYEVPTLKPHGNPAPDYLDREIDQLKQAMKKLSQRNDTLEHKMTTLQKELRHEREARKEVELHARAQETRLNEIVDQIWCRISDLDTRARHKHEVHNDGRGRRTVEAKVGLRPKKSQELLEPSSNPVRSRGHVTISTNDPWCGLEPLTP
jgi:chromosome segregation ATPase